MRAVEEVRGVVLEVSGGTMLLLTDRSELWSGPCPAAVPAVGDVVVVPVPAQRRSGRWGAVAPLSFWAAAAALVALVVISSLPRQVAAPATALIAVDINPSLELRLVASGEVVDATPRNAGGMRVLDGLSLTGLPATDAVAAVVERAGALGYLPADQPPVIMLAVVQLDAAAAAPDAGALGEAARRAAVRIAAGALVAVYVPDPAVLADGDRLGLSPNAVTALNLARARQLTLDPAGVNAGGLLQALAAAGTNLPDLLASRPQGMTILGDPPVAVTPQPPAESTDAGPVRPDLTRSPEGGSTSRQGPGQAATPDGPPPAAVTTGSSDTGGNRGPGSSDDDEPDDSSDGAGSDDSSGSETSGDDDRQSGDDNSGPGSGDSGDDDRSGSRSGDDDRSGSGSGDDDDDDDDPEDGSSDDGDDSEDDS